MALINCPECGKQVSDVAQTCPDCGFPIRECEVGKQLKKEYPLEKKKKFDWKRIVLIVLCVFFPVLGAIFCVDPSKEFIETNGISEIEKIEFTLNVIPMEDYFKE